ncbi:hypothetical protein M1271_00335 [Patescibacteria group bacterium]|nr:hypothetical protein [Patescibacteria group bacterium]
MSKPYELTGLPIIPPGSPPGDGSKPPKHPFATGITTSTSTGFRTSSFDYTQKSVGEAVNRWKKEGAVEVSLMSHKEELEERASQIVDEREKGKSELGGKLANVRSRRAKWENDVREKEINLSRSETEVIVRRMDAEERLARLRKEIEERLLHQQKIEAEREQILRVRSAHQNPRDLKNKFGKLASETLPWEVASRIPIVRERHRGYLQIRNMMDSLEERELSVGRINRLISELEKEITELEEAQRQLKTQEASEKSIRESGFYVSLSETDRREVVQCAEADLHKLEKEETEWFFSTLSEGSYAHELKKVQIEVMLKELGEPYEGKQLSAMDKSELDNLLVETKAKMLRKAIQIRIESGVLFQSELEYTPDSITQLVKEGKIDIERELEFFGQYTGTEKFAKEILATAAEVCGEIDTASASRKIQDKIKSVLGGDIDIFTSVRAIESSNRQVLSSGEVLDRQQAENRQIAILQIVGHAANIGLIDRATFNQVISGVAKIKFRDNLFGGISSNMDDYKFIGNYIAAISDQTVSSDVHRFIARQIKGYISRGSELFSAAQVESELAPVFESLGQTVTDGVVEADPTIHMVQRQKSANAYSEKTGKDTFQFYPDKEALERIPAARRELVEEIAEKLKARAILKGDDKAISAAEISCGQIEGIDFLVANGIVESGADGVRQISFNRDTLNKLLTEPSLSYKTRRDLLGMVMYIASEPVEFANLRLQFSGADQEGIRKLSQIYGISLGTGSLQWGTYIDEALFPNQGSPEGSLDQVLDRLRRNFTFIENPDGNLRPAATKSLIMDIFGSNDHAQALRIIQDMKKTGLLDLSDRGLFNREEEQFFTMLSEEKTGNIAAGYIKKTDGEAFIDFETFNKDFTGSVFYRDGIGEWKFFIPKARFSELTSYIEWNDSATSDNLLELSSLFKAGLVDLPSYNLSTDKELFWQFWPDNRMLLHPHQYKELLEVGLFENLSGVRGSDSRLTTEIGAEKIIKAFDLSFGRVKVNRGELKSIMADPRLKDVISALTGLKSNWGYELTHLENDVKVMKYLLDNPDKMGVIKSFIDFGYRGFQAGNVKLIEKLTPQRTNEILKLSKDLSESAGFKLSRFTTDINALEFVLDHPETRGAITELVEYGYSFKSEDVKALEYVLANRNKVLADLKAIREADASYRYQPTENRYSPYSLVSAQQIVEGRYSSRQCMDIVFALESTKLQPSDFPVLSVINARSDVPADFVPGEVTADIGYSAHEWHKVKDMFKSDHFRNKDAAFEFIYKSLYPDITREKLDNVFILLQNAPRLVDTVGLHDFLRNNLSYLAAMPANKIETYSTIFLQIDQSPSQELQRLKTQLLSELMVNSDPVNSWRKIEEVFIKNNLPTIGKVFRVFEVLYPGHEITQLIKSNNNLSPYLKKSGPRRRMYTIYTDLLNVAVDSGNRSLKEYVECLSEGEILLDKFEREGLASMDESQRKRFGFFLGKLNTLHENSLLGRMNPSRETLPVLKEEDFGEAVSLLRSNLGVQSGQKITGRISEMFLRPVGMNSLNAVLERMKKAESYANSRGLEIVSSAQDGKLNIREGDLLKGIDVNFFEQIMQNGSVAREYLGSGAGSDATPFDTDVSRVTKEDAEAGFEKAFGVSIAKGYGNLVFVVRDRGQFQLTSPETVEFNSQKRELFRSAVVGERHYGIRTGFPTTEIDFMIVQDRLKADPVQLEKIFYTVAQNGYYIPIVDSGGSIIFTPEIYREYRRTFDGIPKYDGERIVAHVSDERFVQNKEVDEIMAKMKEYRQSTLAEQNKIKQIIQEVLTEYGVKLKEEGDTGLLGAEFMDTGSTGRGTNTPGDADYDYALMLDAADFRKREYLAAEIKKRLNPQDDESHTDSGGIQIRAMKSRFIEGRDIDVDIAITSKSDLRVFASHDAIAAKLDSIAKEYGDEVRDRVVANIILTKRVLKEGHAYKKKEHGGIGGIGVENWILQNEGNMAKAFLSFYQAAHSHGQRISLSDFRKKYHMRDAGINVKFLSHDDYVYLLKEDGYNAMLDTIEKYFKDEGAGVDLEKLKYM